MLVVYGARRVEHADPTGHHRTGGVITGGSWRVEAATALALASFGFDIPLTYRDRAAWAEAVVGRIEASGRRASAHVAT